MATPDPDDSDNDSSMSWASLGDENFVPGSDLDQDSSSLEDNEDFPSSDSQSGDELVVPTNARSNSNADPGWKKKQTPRPHPLPNFTDQNPPSHPPTHKTTVTSPWAIRPVKTIVLTQFY